MLVKVASNIAVRLQDITKIEVEGKYGVHSQSKQWAVKIDLMGEVVEIPCQDEAKAELLLTKLVEVLNEAEKAG